MVICYSKQIFGPTVYLPLYRACPPLHSLGGIPLPRHIFFPDAALRPGGDEGDLSSHVYSSGATFALRRTPRHPLPARPPLDHLVRSVKIFRILAERYRNRRKRFGLRFNLHASLCRILIFSLRTCWYTDMISSPCTGHKLKNSAA